MANTSMQILSSNDATLLAIEAAAEEHGYRTLAFEPFTWSWLGLTLAEGAVAWVGGQIFSRIFGASQRSLDLQALLDQVVRQVATVISQAIQDNALRELQGNLNQFQTDFLHYLNAPASDDRLKFATNNVSGAVAQLATLEKAGHAGYMVALCCHICVLQERIKVFGNDERANIKETLQRGIRHAEKMQLDWQSWNTDLFSVRETPSSIHIPYPIDTTLFEILKSGVTVAKFIDSQDAGRARAADKLRELRDYEWLEITYKNYVEPSEKIVVKWKELLASQ